MPCSAGGGGEGDDGNYAVKFGFQQNRRIIRKDEIGSIGGGGGQSWQTRLNELEGR